MDIALYIRPADDYANEGMESLFANSHPVETLSQVAISDGITFFSRAANNASYFIAGSFDEGEYDPNMVAALLKADAKAPEAKFTNVKDMLDWLERD